jgi:hypothetical protein
MDQIQQRDLVNRIRDAYRAFRERVDPTWVMGPAAREDKVWLAAAEIVDRFGADPFEYVRFQFDSHNGSFPQYTQLASEWAIENYRNLSKTLRKAQGIAVFERQVETMLAFVTGGSDPDLLLWDHTKEFTATVRVFMCSNNQLENFLAKYGDRARLELEFDRPLRDYIKQHHYDRAKSVIRAGVPDETPGQPTQSSGIPEPLIAGYLVPSGPRRSLSPCNPPSRPYLHG